MQGSTACLTILLVAAGAAQQHDALTLTRTTQLAGETYHVQGIEVDGSTVWVTSVDTKAKRGLLLEYKLPEGRLIRSIEIHDGVRYHPGGLMASGDSLWIPVAEYKRESSAVIQRRNKKTLALDGQFVVEDHIGAIAVASDALIGANWDARDLYVWSIEGKQLRKIANSSGIALQDMKFAGGSLIGGGLRPDKSGEVVWMKWPSLEVVKRLPVGRTDRGVAYTHEGIAIRGDKLWFLPEDSPSRLFEFRLR
jgi:hypothetical protein